MNDPHKYDISIGKDQWITVGNIDDFWLLYRQPTESITDIDPLLLPMADFWNRLETDCVAACCGIDAFDLWPGNIQRAATGSGDQALPQKLAALRAFIVAGKADYFGSIRLNQLFRRDTLLQLVEHIAGHLPA